MQQLVRQACERLGSIQAVASALGISDLRTVTSWFNGERQPQPRFRADLCRLAGQVPDWKLDSRGDLAARLGLHPSTVAAWQRGDRQVPQRWDELLAGSAASNLRSWRTARNWSQEKLAIELCVSRGTVAAWERGDSIISAAAHAKLISIAGEETLDWWDLSPMRRLRHRYGWTRATAALQFGISEHRLAEWETERVSMPQWASTELAIWETGGEPTLAITLRTARRAVGRTVRDVAERCDVTEETVRAWERGEERPAGSRWQRLARAYCLPVGAVATAAARPRAISGRQLAQWRIKQGFTQRELAKGIGVSWRSVGRWETGRSRPAATAVAALQAFGAPVTA